MSRKPTLPMCIPKPGEVPESPEHARWLLRTLCMALMRSEVKRELVLYFVPVFEQVINGEVADDALGLRRRRAGRPPRIETEGPPSSPQDVRDYFLAGMVFELLKQDSKLEHAYKQAADHWNQNKPKKSPSASYSTVQRAWKRFGANVRAMAVSEKKLPKKERAQFLEGRATLPSLYPAAVQTDFQPARKARVSGNQAKQPSRKK